MCVPALFCPQLGGEGEGDLWMSAVTVVVNAVALWRSLPVESKTAREQPQELVHARCHFSPACTYPARARFRLGWLSEGGRGVRYGADCLQKGACLCDRDSCTLLR